jgi:3-methyladenine DNA glycosylase AlkC
MVIPESILQRKGSSTTSGVPAEVLKLLNAGHIETVNLSEWLVVDQLKLAEVIFQPLGWSKLIPAVKKALASLDKPTAPKRCAAVAQVLTAHFSAKADLLQAAQTLAMQRADIVRNWACLMVGTHPDFSLAEKLHFQRPLAADANMGVREMAWIGLRQHLIAELPLALQSLQPWALDADECVRRFASEATRPRGVWCAHSTVLKQQPELGLPLLEPLKSDPAKYVRDSVGNWLNDAAKTQPDWVRQVCKRWQKVSATKETAYIIKRALRSLQ